MFQIGKSIISDEVIENDFVCNLSSCKGQCCVDGDSGAPLLEDERQVLDDIYNDIEPYLRPEGVEAIKKQGTSIVGDDGEYETPLVNGEQCAYVIHDNGMILCGIEKAYIDKKTNYKKPVSCHLYPIRVKETKNFSTINYHHWDICSDACTLGKELEVPVYKFLKVPLIRRFGEEFYNELSLVAEEWKKQKKSC